METILFAVQVSPASLKSQIKRFNILLQSLSAVFLATAATERLYGKWFTKCCPRENYMNVQFSGVLRLQKLKNAARFSRIFFIAFSWAFYNSENYFHNKFSTKLLWYKWYNVTERHHIWLPSTKSIKMNYFGQVISSNVVFSDFPGRG